jgi:16S rRNA (guanine527-N7)-methyltransferase
VGERTTRSRLLRRAARAHVSLPDSQADALAAYLDLLFRWNRKINLTALTEVDDAIDRLLLEPLVAARHVPNGPGRLIDIGSGGGSPAIPLVLTLADYELTMVESKARKAAFLREVIRSLGLSRTTVETTRFESLLTGAGHRSAYSAFSIRAVRIERQTLAQLSFFLGAGGVGLVFRGATGPDHSGDAPPMAWAGTYPLVPGLGSRLTIYRLSS